MGTSAMPFSGFAHGLEITGLVPAIDHHSHAAYVRPGEKLDTFDALETEVAAGYVESRIPADAYQQFVRATRAGDHDAAEALSARHEIPQLRDAARDLYRTTAFSRALTLGCDALYGRAGRESQLATARVRLDDYRGLYDDALTASSTRSVLTDVPDLDADEWPVERYRQIARIDPYLFPFGHDPYVGRGFDAQRFAAILADKLSVELAAAGRANPHDDLDAYIEFVSGRCGGVWRKEWSASRSSPHTSVRSTSSTWMPWRRGTPTARSASRRRERRIRPPARRSATTSRVSSPTSP